MLAFARKCLVFASKGFQQNLVYLASHLINTVASALFGVIYIYIWKSVIPPSGFGDYTQSIMVYYIVFNQVASWLTQFGMRIHSRIAESVRSGSIATELARPVSYFTYRMTSEIGSQVYSFIFRGLPCGMLLIPVGVYLPSDVMTWAYAAVALALGGYISITMSYMVGISAFWTTEIRTAHWVNITLKYGLGGVSMPLEVLPAPLFQLSLWLPFAHLNYYPARIFLGLSGLEPIWYAVVWSVVLTLAAQCMTQAARRRLEVQGG